MNGLHSGAFNTHRGYTPAGQTVGYCRMGSGLWAFHDLTRGIAHVVDLGPESEGIGPTELKLRLMEAYDNCRYNYDEEATTAAMNAMELARQAACKFEQPPTEEYTFYYTGMDQLDRVEECTFLTREEALAHATYLEEHGAQMLTVCDSHDREIPR